MKAPSCFDHLLLRRVDSRGAARLLGGLDAAGQFVEAGWQVLGAHRRIAELGAAADDRSFSAVEHSRAVARDPDDEDDGRLVAVGQQAGRALAEHRRIEADLLVGHVDRLAARPRLGIDRVAVGDEPTHVGDCVAEDEVASRLLDREGLVEVGRAFRIEGDEGDGGAVDMIRQRLLRRCDCCCLDFGGKAVRELKLRADRREALPERSIAIVNGLQDLTIVTCATSIAPPRKPPSQYIR